MTLNIFKNLYLYMVLFSDISIVWKKEWKIQKQKFQIQVRV